SDRVAHIADRASTKAADPARSQHRSHPPARPAATACNRRIAPQAAQNQAHSRAHAPHSQAKGPAPADPTTSRPQQCDAEPKAGPPPPPQTKNSATPTPPPRKKTPPPAAAGPPPPTTTPPPPAQTKPPPPPAPAASTSCRATPSRSGKIVRRLSWRATTSPSA